ncbi:TlyA family RNA methyltransferase [Nocardioides convexus]|uniref:TlyA family RNA methyltransferase n=1 Tax=Nocardioides convexus TaxID=2712224 RepID=UPI0031017ABD
MSRSWCCRARTARTTSRGARTRLVGALEAFGKAGLRVEGRRALDAGASTGGFTDVLLRAGAAEVVAVDVGYGQLHWSIRQDERVVVHDRTNVRTLVPEQIGGPVDLVVGDLSFISLVLVLDALLGVTEDDGDLALMVKPQFEVGKDRVGKGGVVRDPEPARGGGAGCRARRGRARLGGAGGDGEPAAGALGQRGVLRVAAQGPGGGGRRVHRGGRAARYVGPG